MKILELPAYFWPHQGGIESIVYHLSKEFSKQHQVKIITSNIGSKKQHETLKGLQIKRVPAITFMQDAFAPSLKYNLEKAHIVHIHHPHPWWIYTSAKYCIKKDIPYILHMHGKEIVYPGWKNLSARAFNKHILKHILRKAKKILVHSKRSVTESDILPLFKEKLIYIPHGVELKPLIENQRENFIFTVGVRDYKRLDILIKAMPIVLKKKKTTLVIAGKGEEIKQLRQLTKQLHLQKYVKFLGFISEKKKYELYSRARLFVLPSPTIMESFGTVAFEAFSQKCPVLVTEGAGISEIFRKEKIGILCKPYNVTDMANQIIRILKKPQLGTKIGNYGYKIIKEKYQWKDIAKKYLKVFKSISHEHKFFKQQTSKHKTKTTITPPSTKKHAGNKK